MTGIICSVRGCYNNWRKRREFLQQECIEHRPRLRSECSCGAPYNLHPPPKEDEARRLWIKALNLKNPPKVPFVCSFHFLEKRPTKEHPYPEKWLGYEAPVKKSRRSLPRRISNDDNATTCVMSEATDPPSEPNCQQDVGGQWKDHTLEDHTYSLTLPMMPLHSAADKATQCAEPVFKSLLRTDALAQLYTGLSLAAFHSVAEHLVPLNKSGFQLAPSDQLLMTLMKLKLNLLQEDLAERFGVSQSVVSRILSYWIDHMEENMREYIPWLPRETIRATMPQCFKEHFPSTTCIIDYSETTLQKARNLDSRGESSSYYYAQNTLKYLVAIAPCGLIMFISPAYGGRCSDKFITSDSGFLEYLRPGDEVLADRGFLIRDLLREKKVKLTIPAFAKRGAQLSEEATTCTRRIANVRVHVERIICRLKYFHIISQVVPISLAPKMDKILRICAAMCNLRGDMILEDVE